jgi:hypothetical protein
MFSDKIKEKYQPLLLMGRITPEQYKWLIDQSIDSYLMREFTIE